ncbi:MAG: oxygen-insensitive NADPH nitroreductase [Phycisphaerales bacterium]|nr:MAG: oxygen-insensitive NADPH nitroreductase [Phycisphaerales bacterium]
MTDANPTIELMRQHRSIRQYTEDAVPDDDIASAVAAAQCASTSSNVQAYCIIRVRDAATRARLIEVTGGQEKVAKAGAFFLICADSRRHRLLVERAGGRYRGGLEEFLVGVIDASLFAQNLSLAFESQGFGICYIGSVRNDLKEADRLLALPEGVYPLFGLCVGVPDQDPPLRPRLPVEAVLMEERYPADEVMLAAIDQYDEETRSYFRGRSGEDRDWSGPISTRFTKPGRRDLAAYYHAKGADLT